MPETQDDVVAEALDQTGCRDVSHLVGTLLASIDSYIRVNAQIAADNIAARNALADSTKRFEAVTDGVRFGCECGRFVSIVWDNRCYFPAGHDEDGCMAG